MPHIPAHLRRWIYGVSLAAVPLLVALGILEDAIAPLVIALVGAVVAPGLALANVTADATDEAHWMDESIAMWAEMDARDE
jgi:hypothetical protein